MLPGGPHLGYDDHGAWKKKVLPNFDGIWWKKIPSRSQVMHGLYMAIFCWKPSPNFLIGDTILHGGFVICVMLVCHLSFHGLLIFQHLLTRRGFTRSDLVSLTIFPWEKRVPRVHEDNLNWEQMSEAYNWESHGWVAEKHVFFFFYRFYHW